MSESDIDGLGAISGKILTYATDASQYAFPLWTGNAIGHYGMKDEWERLYKEVKLFWGFYTSLFGVLVFFLVKFGLGFLCNFFPFLNINFQEYCITTVALIGVIFSILTFIDARRENIAVWRRISNED